MSDPRALFAHRVRAGVVAYLWDQGAADFATLAAALEVANNQLSGHLDRLEQGGVIQRRRGFLGRKPRTTVVLTTDGRAAWRRHLDGSP
ncbi:MULTISPECIES: transcriptional regulator [Brevundimonas]|uniref:transcriptional regulator n=1 Tax=Brevundimonas TaxID=41275 RepID=UPI0013CE62A3|nr:transcriptional regulator [Brevundimonas lutea]